MVHHSFARRSGRILAGITVAALPAAGMLTASTPAQAATPATVSLVNGAAIVYFGGTGQLNNVRVFVENGQVTITDSVAITTAPGSGCTVVSGIKARCGSAVTGLSMSLGDLDDRVTFEAPLAASVRGDDGNDTFRSAVRGGLSAVTYDGGAGFRDAVEYRSASSGVTVSLNDASDDGRTLTGDRDNVRSTVENLTGSTFGDTLVGNDLRNTIDGLTGDDSLRGQGGTDLFPSSFQADGADSISGGDGDRDAVSYRSRGRGVVVDLDNVADDGEPGERDNIGVDVENLNGTEFPDTLIGSSASNFLEGFAGNDFLNGLGERDSLRAGAGADTVVGDAGDDSFTTNVDGERDVLSCGANRDSFDDDRGLDVLFDCEVRF